MQLVLAKSANSAASCVCSINNGTGGVSTGLSLMLFLLVGAAAQLVTQESGAYVMHLATSCQLQHIVYIVYILISAFAIEDSGQCQKHDSMDPN